MRIHSDSFENGKPIPPEFAMGAPGGFGGNRNPHLAWDDVPEGTRSFALLCIDPDAPTVAETVGRDDMDIPVWAGVMPLALTAGPMQPEAGCEGREPPQRPGFVAEWLTPRAMGLEHSWTQRTGDGRIGLPQM